MILIDTSVWIEFFRKTDKSIDIQLCEHLENAHAIAISVVFGELLQGVRSVREEKIVLEYWKNLPKVNEDNLFIESGRLSFQFKLFPKGVGLLDCYILAAARRYNLNLWTLDKKLLQACSQIQ